MLVLATPISQASPRTQPRPTPMKPCSPYKPDSSGFYPLPPCLFSRVRVFLKVEISLHTDTLSPANHNNSPPEPGEGKTSTQTSTVSSWSGLCSHPIIALVHRSFDFGFLFVTSIPGSWAYTCWSSEKTIICDELTVLKFYDDKSLEASHNIQVLLLLVCFFFWSLCKSSSDASIGQSYLPSQCLLNPSNVSQMFQWFNCSPQTWLSASDGIAFHKYRFLIPTSSLLNFWSWGHRIFVPPNVPQVIWVMSPMWKQMSSDGMRLFKEPDIILARGKSFPEPTLGQFLYLVVWFLSLVGCKVHIIKSNMTIRWKIQITHAIRGA